MSLWMKGPFNKNQQEEDALWTTKRSSPASSPGTRRGSPPPGRGMGPTAPPWPAVSSTTRRDQEECLSDTWLRAWNAIPPQRPRSLGAFLAKITRNLAINRLRDGNAQRRGGGQVPLALEELGECVSPEGSPEGELDRQAAAEALDRFLDGLPPLQREVFLRRYWHLDSQ